jgi:hypothetical protein
MTAKLEAAIKQLSEEEIQHLTALAEFYAQRHTKDGAGADLKLSWVGCLADAPEKSGVEMARRANQMRIELIEKSRPK